MVLGRALKVVVVDDDVDFLAILAEIVREAGGEPLALSSLSSAIEVIERGDIDAVLTDYRLSSDGGGGDVIVRACHAGARIPVAVVSVIDSAELACALVRLGADDYLLKPTSAFELLPNVRTFLEGVALEIEARSLGALPTKSGDRPAMEMLRASRALKPLLRDLPGAAKSGANVLVYGESGTGKELAARAVHDLSRRAGGPFVAVDCGAIPENLLENEFFGHKKGAYSDARDDGEGLVQRSAGGTLFLDEIGELPMPMQAKLLRFMQTREYRRLGDANVARADVRFVAATNRDLASAVRAGKFREDLYYRINVIALKLPALRERLVDIPMLAIGFVHKYAAGFDSPALSLSREAIDELCRRPWPGNVRQLENVIQRVVALATGPVISAAALSETVTSDLATSAKAEPTAETIGNFHEAKQHVIEQFERQYAQQLVVRHAGNLTAAARAAGLDRKSLARLLTRHGLAVGEILDS